MNGPDGLSDSGGLVDDLLAMYGPDPEVQDDHGAGATSRKSGSESGDGSVEATAEGVVAAAGDEQAAVDGHANAEHADELDISVEGTEHDEVSLDDTELDDTELDDTELDDTELDDTELDDTELDDTELDDTELDDTEHDADVGKIDTGIASDGLARGSGAPASQPAFLAAGDSALSWLEKPALIDETLAVQSSVRTARSEPISMRTQKVEPKAISWWDAHGTMAISGVFLVVAIAVAVLLALT